MSDADSIVREKTDFNHDYISDREFIDSLITLRTLRWFLLNQSTITLPANFSLGSLNLLQFRKGGRQATLQEWLIIEEKSAILFEALTPDMRFRFAQGRSPIFIPIVAACLALFAATALVCAVFVQDRGFFGIKGIGPGTLPFYVIWLMSLGALGAIANVALNTLSIQNDIDFDIKNTRLVLLRATIGALFALIISIST